MKPHEWFVEHRGDYAAGVLDAADSDAFEAHLPHCAECAAEVARLEHQLRWLPMGAPPVAPRPQLRRRIVEQVLDGGRQRRINRIQRVALAAAVLLAIAAWMAGDRRARALEDRLAAVQQHSAALSDTLSIIRGATRVIQTSVESDGHRGGMIIFADSRTHRWDVVLHGLPPAPAGTRYQFWFICSDGMVRGAELNPADARPASFTTGMPEQGGDVLGAALSVEPMDADSGPPKGKVLVHVML